jgi:hypothetical protein
VIALAPPVDVAVARAIARRELVGEESGERGLLGVAERQREAGVAIERLVLGEALDVVRLRFAARGGDELGVMRSTTIARSSSP